MLDYEVKLTEIIQEYKAGDKHRWAAAFAIGELWVAFPTRHGEIMSVLVNELCVISDQIYNLIHAAELASQSELSRALSEKLSPSHFYRLRRASEKYKLDSGAVEDYLEQAAASGMSAQAMIEEVMNAYEPDASFMWHRALRGVERSVRKLLQMAEYNGLDVKAREAARLLLSILEDMR